MTTATVPPQHATATHADTRLVIRRTLPAPPARVFAAWTRPDLVQRWLCPGALSVEQAQLDPRVGGSYRIVMRTPEGAAHTPTGTYEQVVANEKLVFSWRWEGSEPVTRVTVELRPVGDDQTELILTHEGFADAAARTAHDEGWTGTLAKLPQLLESARARRRREC